MPNVWVAKKPFLFLGFLLLIISCKEEPQTLFEKESRYQINGSEVYVKQMAMGGSEADAFSKEALLIVHGGPVMDHSYFLPYLNDLAASFHLIFYDQRACGLSSAEVDATTLSLDGFVEDIDLLRKALGLNKINLMGHSWGGLLAMKYGIKYVDNLDKLVLSNSMAPSVTDWQRETAIVGQKVTKADIDARDALMSSGVLQSDDPREGVRTLLLQSFKYQMYDAANLEKLNLYVPIDYVQRSKVFGALSSELSSFDLYNDLNKVTCPTLLIYGETEPAKNLYTGKMLSLMPDASLEVVMKAGHFPFIEQQAEFNELVTDFLND